VLGVQIIIRFLGIRKRQARGHGLAFSFLQIAQFFVCFPYQVENISPHSPDGLTERKNIVAGFSLRQKASNGTEVLPVRGNLKSNRQYKYLMMNFELLNESILGTRSAYK
jgi:hypothetical protein